MENIRVVITILTVGCEVFYSLRTSRQKIMNRENFAQFATALAWLQFKINKVNILVFIFVLLLFLYTYSLQNSLNVMSPIVVWRVASSGSFFVPSEP